MVRLLTIVAVPQAEQAEGARIEWTKHQYDAENVPRLPGVSHVNWVFLADEDRLDCLVCDMRQGLVLLWKNNTSQSKLVTLAKLDKLPSANAN